MKKILLTGASGFLGSNFCHLFSNHFDIYAIQYRHDIQNENVHVEELNLTDAEELESLFRNISPDAVVHLAALSDPNQCQLNPIASEKINVDVSEYLAGLCKEARIPFIFTSTDLVFDGKSAPYKESDIPAPVSTYGLHKSIAEQAVLDMYPESTICRLPLMYGINYSENQSMLQPMLENLHKGLPLMLFTDEFRTFASATDVCNGIVICMDHPGEIFHLGGDESISRYEFGRLVCKVFGHDVKLLIKSKQKDINMAASRPKNVSLVNTKAKAIGWKPKDICFNLEAIRNELESAGNE